MNIKKLIITLFAAALFFGYINTASVLAAESTDKSKREVDRYELNDDVNEWLDAGNSILADVKYSTLASTDHLWMLDDTDISDGKVILSVGEESREICGIAMRDWLKTQYFYGENLGADDNRKKFIRPKKTVAF